MKHFISCTVSHLFLKQSWCECEYYFIVPTLQIRKLSLRGVNWLAHVNDIARIW